MRAFFMPNRTSPIHEATMQAAWTLQQVGRELRLARILGGKTQTWVAQQLRRSQARVSLIERGKCASATLIELSTAAAAVGLRLYVKPYPGGRRLLDKPQQDLLGRFRVRIGEAWRWEQEVPMPIAGDLRAGDARISIPGCNILVEAITRLADAQAQARAAQLKRRDLGADRLVLLVGDTAANRRALREAGEAFAAAFPLGTRRTLAMLLRGKDPGADAIVLL